jgi:tetratricopeptide (TPR) repeat protein
MSDAALLEQLDELAAAGRYADVRDRVRGLPAAVVEARTRLALHASEAEGRLGDVVAAARWADIALRLARARGEQYGELRARNFHGAIALARGAVDEAERHFSDGVALARLLGDHGTEARCLNNLGILANIRGDPEAALGRYRLAIVAYQQVGLARGVSETQHNMGISLRDQRDFRRALEAAEEAVRLARAAGDERLAALAAVGRAELHLLLGDAAFAGAELDRAAATYERLGFPSGLPEVWRVQAAVERARGDTAAALRLLRGAARAAEQQASADVLADIERDLGSALAHAGDTAGARAARERASALYRRLGASARADATIRE